MGVHLDLKEVERLSSLYKITMEEAYDLWVYDNEYCTSNKKAKQRVLDSAQLPKEMVDKMFEIEQRVAKPVVRSDQNYIKQVRADILTYFVDNLNDGELFIDPVISGSTVNFTSPATGKKVSIKYTSNKEKKVFGKFVKRADEPTLEERQIEYVWDLVNHAVANGLIGLAEINGTNIGFKLDDEKYPFASLKITFHKK